MKTLTNYANAVIKKFRKKQVLKAVAVDNFLFLHEVSSGFRKLVYVRTSGFWKVFKTSLQLFDKISRNMQCFHWEQLIEQFFFFLKKYEKMKLLCGSTLGFWTLKYNPISGETVP
jgi:hypothetical protein